MNTLKISEQDTYYFLTVPYALNQTFREIFKTAQWNSSAKAFFVKKTSQNLNKWNKFVEISEKSARSLAEIDDTEASADELQRAHSSIQKLLEELEKREIRAKLQIAVLTPLHAEAKRKLAELENATKMAEAERDELIAPALQLYKKHDIEKIIALYQKGANRGYSGKSMCQEAAKQLLTLRNDLRSVGFQVAAIDELLNTSLNRIDQIGARTDVLSRQRISGIMAYKPEITVEQEHAEV